MSIYVILCLQQVLRSINTHSLNVRHTNFDTISFLEPPELFEGLRQFK